MAEKLYILGHPVAHSKSPDMHNAAYQALGLHWEYGFADCDTEMSAQVFLNALNWRACNVTMPWKPLAYEFATVRSDAAELARGANVLVNWAGRVHADNTDGKGCVSFLRRCGVRFEGEAVSVCGTGPTSLAIAHACARAGASRVNLFGRDLGRTQEVVGEYRRRLAGIGAAAGAGAGAGAGAVAGAGAGAGAGAVAGVGMAGAGAGVNADAAGANEQVVQPCTYDSSGEAALAASAVIVDATPLGMQPGDPAPFDVSVLAPSQTVLDVVYGHGETALLAAARKAGCAAYDGAGMLVAQAVETVIDISQITGFFDIPAHMDLFSIMAQAAGFDL